MCVIFFYSVSIQICSFLNFELAHFLADCDIQCSQREPIRNSKVRKSAWKCCIVDCSKKNPKKKNPLENEIENENKLFVLEWSPNGPLSSTCERNHEEGLGWVRAGHMVSLP